MVSRLISESVSKVSSKRVSGIPCELCNSKNARIFKCLCGYTAKLCKRCSKEHLRNCDSSYCGFCGLEFKKGDTLIKCKIHHDFVHKECFPDHLEEIGVNLDTVSLSDYLENEFVFTGFFERLRKR